MKKFNVGVIGYGWVAGAHIDAINATGRGQVTAVCSSRKLDPVELSKAHGSEIQCHSGLKKMLGDPAIDVISVCSYPYQHARQIIAAAEAGKHLIIEKPVVLNLKDLRAIQKAVAKADVQTCVCFECRFSSQFLATKAVIDRGLLGKIHYGEVDYYHGIGPWYGQFRWNTKRNAGGSSLL
ncbi:MAG TPA: Gfo/Idh/MocA family oxidoreductase, partial [Verrucomicrobiota bacterium]|nr:Gfo/Idh/MocA family oxidoreductase [Verrucomicrobiota bacterium]